MSTIEKLVERIPYSDGGFRRRLSAGVVFVAGVSIFANTQGVQFAPFEALITNPTVAIVLLVLVYALGGLIEAIAELFVTRLVGNFAWAWSQPKRIAAGSPRFIRPVVHVLAYYPGIVAILLSEFAKAMAGRSSFVWKDLENRLHQSSRSFFRDLPDVVRLGLERPFGEYSELAWSHMTKAGGDAVAVTLRRLEARNKDTLVIVTAMSIFFLFLVPWYLYANGREIESGLFVVQLVVLQVIISLPVLLLTTYYLLIKQSIITAIESVALAANTDRKPYTEGSESPSYDEAERS